MRLCLISLSSVALLAWHVGASFRHTLNPNTFFDQDAASFSPSLITWANDLVFVNDTAVTLQFTLNIINSYSPNIATNFEVEIAHGQYSEDFNLYAILPVDRPSEFSNNSYVSNYTIGSLLSEAYYRFKVIPVFSNGRGYPSAALTIVTLAPSKNYWEPVMSRRLSLQDIGRGFSNPVTERPHLDTGVETSSENTHNNPHRYSDPDTSEAQKLPSGRRGHSLSPVDDFVYMFGGRTNGYSCASVYKDILSFGVVESGRYVKPCTFFQGEVWEMWRLDLNTYQWAMLNTTQFLDINITTNELIDPLAVENQHPEPREQHTAVVVGGDIYVYGGKARYFATDDNGEYNFTAMHADQVFGDLWKFTVEHPIDYVFAWMLYGQVFTISEDFEVPVVNDARSIPAYVALSDGISNREGMCIQKLTVKVQITHPCINQLELRLAGPGPYSGDQNYFPSSMEHRVALYTQRYVNGTGCAGGTHYFEFDDESQQALEEVAITKMAYNSPGRKFRPDGRLSEFVGTSMTSKWTLYITDTKKDSIAGTLDSWDITFTSGPCHKEYKWTNLTSSIPRYGGKAISNGNYIFVFGGRDKDDIPLQDLYRYDTTADTWLEMTPVGFDKTVLASSSSVGSNYMLSTWGLLRFGGYFRQPKMTSRVPELADSVTGYVSCETYGSCGGVNGGHYDNSVYLQDPITLKWRPLEVYAWPNSIQDHTFSARRPVPRYLAASAFISSSTLSWRTKFTHRTFYDQTIASSQANQQGSISDSILLFGGFDGSSGIIYDGSSGGYFNDMWMLRLSNLSTPGSRFLQQDYLDTRCRWRTATAATKRCITTDLSLTKPPCDFKDLMMLAWCAQQNQTVM